MRGGNRAGRTLHTHVATQLTASSARLRFFKTQRWFAAPHFHIHLRLILMFWRKQQPLRQFYFPRQPCCGGTVQGTRRRWPVTRHGITARPVVRAGACHSDIALTVCRCLRTPRSSWVPGVLPESAPPVPIPGVTGLALPPAGPPPPSALSSRSPHCAPHGFRGGPSRTDGRFHVWDRAGGGGISTGWVSYCRW